MQVALLQVFLKRNCQQTKIKYFQKILFRHECEIHVMWCGFQHRCQSFIRPLRRLYHVYKPKDKVNVPETPLGDNFATRDILLFRYEDPQKIFRWNLLAGTMLPVWSYLGYTAWGLNTAFAPYKEELERSDRGWVFRNVEAASRGVSVGFFSFGVCISVYWLLRNMNTVRRVILRKGGKHLTLITYGLFGITSRQLTFPVSHVMPIFMRTLFPIDGFFL